MIISQYRLINKSGKITLYIKVAIATSQVLIHSWVKSPQSK